MGSVPEGGQRSSLDASQSTTGDAAVIASPAASTLSAAPAQQERPELGRFQPRSLLSAVSHERTGSLPRLPPVAEEGDSDGSFEWQPPVAQTAPHTSTNPPASPAAGQAVSLPSVAELADFDARLVAVQRAGYCVHTNVSCEGGLPWTVLSTTRAEQALQAAGFSISGAAGSALPCLLTPDAAREVPAGAAWIRGTNVSLHWCFGVGSLVLKCHSEPLPLPLHLAAGTVLPRTLRQFVAAGVQVLAATQPSTMASVSVPALAQLGLWAARLQPSEAQGEGTQVTLELPGIACIAPAPARPEAVPAVSQGASTCIHRSAGPNPERWRTGTLELQSGDVIAREPPQSVQAVSPGSSPVLSLAWDDAKQTGARQAPHNTAERSPVPAPTLQQPAASLAWDSGKPGAASQASSGLMDQAHFTSSTKQGMPKSPVRGRKVQQGNDTTGRRKQARLTRWLRAVPPGPGHR